MPFLGVCTSEFAPRYALISPWMNNGHLLDYLRENSSTDRQLMVRNFDNLWRVLVAKHLSDVRCCVWIAIFTYLEARSRSWRPSCGTPDLLLLWRSFENITLDPVECID